MEESRGTYSVQKNHKDNVIFADCCDIVGKHFPQIPAG